MNGTTDHARPSGDAGATASEEAIDLPSDAASARVAREWVREQLLDWPDARVETARLLTSEIVTNAVLHARTPISLRVRRGGDRVRVEVADEHAAGPLPKRFSADSPTGRGLRLVLAMADRWGVDRTSTGKVVWYELREDPGAAPASAPTSAPAAGSLPDLSGWPDLDDVLSPGLATEAVGADMVRVRIAALPVAVYLEAEQHNDAIMRELALLLQSSEASVEDLAVPRQLMDLAAVVQGAFATATSVLRVQVERALRDGRDTVDLELDVPRHGWQLLLRLADQLDELDRYCETGLLMTTASSPTLRRFRTWYAQEVARQVNGDPARPWDAPEPPGAAGVDAPGTGHGSG